MVREAMSLPKSESTLNLVLKIVLSALWESLITAWMEGGRKPSLR